MRYTLNIVLMLITLVVFSACTVYFGQGTARIATKAGKHYEFAVEVASTNRQMARGLMYREQLGSRAGMLFLYGKEEIASMWMKNTKIPLDMLFIHKDGSIAKIEADTVPGSLRSISSDVPVIAALELNAGTSKSLGITVGDKVEWVLVDK